MPLPVKGLPDWRLPELTVQQGGRLLAATLLIAVVTAELYAAAARLVSPSWLAALVVNLLIAAVVVTTLHRRQPLGRVVGLGWPACLPAAVVLFGSALLAAFSQALDHTVLPAAQLLAAVPWAWITLVPVAEEVVFRGGFGLRLARLGPPLWAAWFSAAAFALVHASPTVEHLLERRWGLPLGPFLLGLACEALRYRTGSLVPGILLHAACNATVIVFQLLDPRWLDWLGALYG